MAIPLPFNLNQWIEDNRELLKPPIGNKNLYVDAKDFIVMIVAVIIARRLLIVIAIISSLVPLLIVLLLLLLLLLSPLLCLSLLLWFLFRFL